MSAIFMAMLIFAITLIIYDNITFKASQVRDMQIVADMVGSNSTAALSFNNPIDAEETLKALEAEHHITAGGIYDADGNLFAQYTRSDLPNEQVPPHIEPQGYRFTKDSLIIFRDIILKNEVVGAVFLKANMDRLQARINNFVTVIVLTTLGTLIIIFALVSRLQRVISRPILDLAAAARRISATKDYSIRVSRTHRDELGFLVDKFNEMLEKIKNREEELRHAHLDLEQRVEERTLELRHEIAQRRKAEDHIRASLQEKEILLKEIHHRVKNNLQVISSLLSMQGRAIKDPDMRAKFKDSEGRVKSMALIHEKLYRSDDLAKVDYADYVQNLISYLRRTYMTNAQSVTILSDIEAVKLGVDLAVPCGLIINELVSNSLKHAFPDGGQGEITISFREVSPGEFTLKIKDNGIGFPENFDLQTSTSLGMQLVTTLAAQISGKLTIERSGGTLFTVSFGEMIVREKELRHA